MGKPIAKLISEFVFSPLLMISRPVGTKDTTIFPAILAYKKKKNSRIHPTQREQPDGKIPALFPTLRRGWEDGGMVTND